MAYQPTARARPLLAHERAERAAKREEIERAAVAPVRKLEGLTRFSIAMRDSESRRQAAGTLTRAPRTGTGSHFWDEWLLVVGGIVAFIVIVGGFAYYALKHVI